MSVSRKLNLSLGLEDDAPNVQVNIDTDEGGMPLDNITEDGEPTPEADEVELKTKPLMKLKAIAKLLMNCKMPLKHLSQSPVVNGISSARRRSNS